MKNHSQIAIDLEERHTIERMLKEKHKISDISAHLGRHYKTISREVASCGGRLFYDAEKSHKMRMKKQILKPPLSIPFTPGQLEIAKKGMKEGLPKHAIREMLGITMKRCVKFFKEHFPDYKGVYGKGMPEMNKRITALEMQIEIITEQLRKLNDRN
jgi:Helix-turn-helix domain